MAGTLGSSQSSPLPHAAFSVAKIDFLSDMQVLFMFFSVLFSISCCKEKASLCQIAAQAIKNFKKIKPQIIPGPSINLAWVRFLD